jgi:F-type H+-transporting ATPase subunit delta
MSVILAKRYVEALLYDTVPESFVDYQIIFSTLSQNFKESKFSTIINSDLISREKKEEILLSSISSLNDKKVENFVKLLIEKRRLSLIPFIAEELRQKVAKIQNKYDGEILSSTLVSVENLQAIANGLSKKLDKNIVLTARNSSINGLKVVVNDLNLEITLSKDMIESKLVSHILKAI